MLSRSFLERAWEIRRQANAGRPRIKRRRRVRKAPRARRMDDLGPSVDPPRPRYWWEDKD